MITNVLPPFFMVHSVVYIHKVKSTKLINITLVNHNGLLIVMVVGRLPDTMTSHDRSRRGLVVNGV